MLATRAPRAARSAAVARHGHAQAESVLVWILRPADASCVARMGAWEKAWVPDVVFEQDALDLAEKGESAYTSVYRKESQAMGMNLAQKLIASHLVEGRMEVGTEIGLKIDQTLTQDAIGKIIEYYGPGLACLSAMDRHVIANMGAELGATTTVFPSDNAVKRFLVSQER